MALAIPKISPLKLAPNVGGLADLHQGFYQLTGFNSSAGLKTAFDFTGKFWIRKLKITNISGGISLRVKTTADGVVIYDDTIASLTTSSPEIHGRYSSAFMCEKSFKVEIYTSDTNITVTLDAVPVK